MDTRGARPGAGDSSLVALARAGEHGACEVLYRRHSAMANRFAYRLLGRDGEVDDVVQDAFVTAFATLGRLDEGKSFSSWLCAILARTAMRARRRRRLLERFGFFQAKPLDLEGFVAPDASLDLRAEVQSLYAHMDRMPENLRTVLVLYRVEGMGQPEIAALLGVSTRTIKRWLARADAAVARRVGRGGGT
jgi:RNA polymerase sigma-70 factor (ECF subfamily)